MPRTIDRLNTALEGRYRIERELGEGGMATVYLAEDLKHIRKVALKVLKPELAAVVGADRFLAEIETTASLTHPHILPLHDSGEAEFAADGTSGPGTLLYYVMPYVEGESLRERLEREHQLPVDEAVGIATNVAEALDYAHRQGVLHRDIKPANILLQDGKPVISDFGIALAVGAAGGGRLTETGLSMGTPHYMSPEQATGDTSLSPATDVYALGCVLYEMLVGQPPFTGSTPQAVLGKIITGEVPSASEERASVPAHIDSVIRKALEKLPADRFRSAGEFAAAIADPGFRHGTDRAGAAAGVSPRAWRSLAIGALLVALITTGAASGVLLRAPPPEAPRPIRFTLTSAADGGVRPTGGYLAVSPDGDEVVFIGVEDGQVRLYRRSLASPEVRPIPGTEDVRSTFAFSPDGGSVAFWTPDQILRTVPLEGGAALPLAEVPDPPIGLGWSSEVGVVMGMLAYNFSFRGLSVADQRQEGIRAITSPEDIQMHHDAYVLEDGRHALHVHWRPGGNRHSLARTSLTDGTTETFDIPGTSVLGALGVVGVADGVLLFRDAAGLLMAVLWDEEDLAPVGSPMRVPGVPPGLRYAYLAADGTLAMAVSADEFDIVLADDRGRVISTVSDESVERAYPRFSPDGGRAALAARIDGSSGLWLYELDSGLLSRLPVGTPPGAIDWTPDGRRILAAAAEAGSLPETRRLWMRSADASDEPAVALELPNLRWIWSASLAPDGQTVAVALNEGGTLMGLELLDIYAARLGQDSILEPLATDAANEVAPRISPDGRWIAYASDESGRYQVYVRPFPGAGPRIQVSADGGGQPVWSGDGSRLFYRTEEAVMVAELSVDSSGSLFVDGRQRLFEGEFFGGPGAVRATFDVHPDGERFILARPSSGQGAAIVVWRDWIGELKEELADTQN